MYEIHYETAYKSQQATLVQRLHSVIRWQACTTYRLLNYTRTLFSLNRRSETEIKVKVKFTLQQATKAQRGSRGIALLFL